MTGKFRIMIEVHANGRDDAVYAEDLVERTLEEYGYEAVVWLDESSPEAGVENRRAALITVREETSEEQQP